MFKEIKVERFNEKEDRVAVYFEEIVSYINVRIFLSTGGRYILEESDSIKAVAYNDEEKISVFIIKRGMYKELFGFLQSSFLATFTIDRIVPGTINKFKELLTEEELFKVADDFINMYEESLGKVKTDCDECPDKALCDILKDKFGR